METVILSVFLWVIALSMGLLLQLKLQPIQPDDFKLYTLIIGAVAMLLLQQTFRYGRHVLLLVAHAIMAGMLVNLCFAEFPRVYGISYAALVCGLGLPMAIAHGYWWCRWPHDLDLV